MDLVKAGKIAKGCLQYLESCQRKINKFLNQQKFKKIKITA